MEIEKGKYYLSATGTKEGPMVGKSFKWIEFRESSKDPWWYNDGTPRNEAAQDIGALIAEWVDKPTTPQIEVGKTYPDRIGNEFECVFIKDGVAWMSSARAAFRYNLDGTPIDLTSSHNTINLGPVRGEVAAFFCANTAITRTKLWDATHKITIPTLDGKPAVGTYTGENGLSVKIEGVE